MISNSCCQWNISGKGAGGNKILTHGIGKDNIFFFWKWENRIFSIKETKMKFRQPYCNIIICSGFDKNVNKCKPIIQ